MAQTKFGQAKGLEALFKTAGISDMTLSSQSQRTLRLSELEPRKNQPRRQFDEESLHQLAASIKSNGVLQPILVTRQTNGFYSIVAGERRYRASKIAGLLEMPVIIIDADERKIAEISLIENLQREDLNPLEEAMAYKTLLDEHALTQDELSQRIGKSRSAISNSIRLLDLPNEVLDLINNQKLSSGHARTLLSLIHRKDMIEAANIIVLKELSVRMTEELVKSLNDAAKKGGKQQKTAVDTIRVDYRVELERRVKATIGREIKILGKGKTRRVQISFSSNDDLEDLIKSLCGESFFDNY